MVHIRAVKSISSQVARRTAPDREAVSIANCNAFAAIPSRLERSTHQRETSLSASAGWLSLFATFAGLGRISERLPFHRAGLSPDRCPATVAHERTFSMRPRSRLAVSVFSHQIGSSTRKMSCTAISATSFEPRMGIAYVSSVDRHCLRCFSLRNSVSLMDRYFSTACEKLSFSLASRLSASGSPPNMAFPWFSNARSRALARGTAGGLPSPSSQRLPRIVMRCTHCFEPFVLTRRNRPCPSKYLPGSETVSTKRAVSLRSCLLMFALGIYPPLCPPRKRGTRWSVPEYLVLEKP